MPFSKDDLNRFAYDDVLDCKEPSLPHNPEYMARYHFWVEIAGPKHFDRYYSPADHADYYI